MASLIFLRYSFVVLATFLLWSCFQGHLPSEASVLEEKYSGAVVTTTKVNLPADELWAVYRSPNFLKIFTGLRPEFYTNVRYVSGHGGVGTIVKYAVTPALGTSVEYWYDKITRIDDKTKTRVQTQLQGRFLNSGFTYFATEYSVVSTGKGSSIIRFSLLLDIKNESRSNVSLVMNTWDPAIVIADYVNSIRSKPVVLRLEFGGEIVSDMHVNLPANQLWQEYRRLDFPYLLLELMPYYYRHITIENGNGGPGSNFNITLQPAYGSLHYIEHNLMISDKNKTRAVDIIQGGALNFGLITLRNTYPVIPKTRNASIIRGFSNYTIRPEALSNVCSLVPFWDHGIAMVNYTLSKSNQFSNPDIQEDLLEMGQDEQQLKDVRIEM